MAVEVIKYYNEYVLDVHMLADPPKYYKRLHVHNTRDFVKTSLTELTEAGVLEGPEQKMFLLISSASSPDPGLTKMEMLLNANNQIDIALECFSMTNYVLFRS